MFGRDSFLTDSYAISYTYCGVRTVYCILFQTVVEPEPYHFCRNHHLSLGSGSAPVLAPVPAPVLGMNRSQI
jgi:hypothetical protein